MAGSALDGKTVISAPADWLPDGRYVYLDGRRLYVGSPTSTTDQLVATLDLPDNSVLQDGANSIGVELSVSPDGSHIAFHWGVMRAASDGDRHIFVARIDGSGLHQVTAPPDPTSALDFAYQYPSWSPDGQWIVATLYMNGSTVAPIFPTDQSFPGVPGGVIGTTGCSTNPVFALPRDAQKVQMSWPAVDPTRNIKVLNDDGNGGRWLTSCGTVYWID
jgi:hypothetical protein